MSNRRTQTCVILYLLSSSLFILVLPLARTTFCHPAKFWGGESSASNQNSLPLPNSFFRRVTVQKPTLPLSLGGQNFKNLTHADRPYECYKIERNPQSRMLFFLAFQRMDSFDTLQEQPFFSRVVFGKNESQTNSLKTSIQVEHEE